MTLFFFVLSVILISAGVIPYVYAQNASSPDLNPEMKAVEACVTMRNLIANSSGSDYTSNVTQYKMIFHCDQTVPWLKVPPPKK